MLSLSADPNYQINFGTTLNTFNDTIVMRDRGITLQIFSPFVF